MALSILLVIITAAVFTQPNAARFIAAAAFTGAVLVHDVALSSLDGVAYYGSAALFSLAVISAISRLDRVPEMALELQKVCLASIVINCGGWLLWLFYSPPMPYDAAFIALYCWAAYILTIRGRADVGRYFSSCGGRAGLFSASRPWLQYLSKHEGPL